MTESSAKIVFKADAKQGVAEAKKLETAIDSAAKAPKRMANEFGKVITKVALLQQALTKAGNAFSTLVSKSAETSKSAGASRLSLASSFASLGSKDIGGDVFRAESASGGATIQEIESFASSLAEQQKDARGKLTPEDAMLAVKKYAAGGALAFGSGGNELLSGIGRGLGVEGSARAALDRRPGLPGFATDTSNQVFEELGLRQKERLDALDVNAARRAAGRQARAGAGAIERRSATGSFASTVADLAPDVIREGAQMSQGARGMDQVRGAIETQTQFLRQRSNKPTLAPGSDQ